MTSVQRGKEIFAGIGSKSYGSKICKGFLLRSFKVLTGYEQQGVFVGGEEHLHWLLIRRTIPGTEIIVDPCAAFLVAIVTALLCIGIREVNNCPIYFCPV